MHCKCYCRLMNHHDGIEPYKFSLSLRNDVIEIVLLYQRQDGCIYWVTVRWSDGTTAKWVRAVAFDDLQ